MCRCNPNYKRVVFFDMNNKIVREGDRIEFLINYGTSYKGLPLIKKGDILTIRFFNYKTGVVVFVENSDFYTIGDGGYAVNECMKLHVPKTVAHAELD